MRIVVLDRDGTLIDHVPYLCDPEGVKVKDDAKEFIDSLLSKGTVICLHTNQSGVGRGYYTIEAVHRCNTRMLELLGLEPSVFHRVCIAPEAPEEPSLYRKPSSAFALELMAELNCSPAELWYIGDRECDLRTAYIAGAKGVGVSTGLVDLRAETAPFQELSDFPIVDSLSQAVQFIV